MASPTPLTQDEPLKPLPKTIHLSTTEAYDAWASVYDTDGNMLQAVDDIQNEKLLSPLLRSMWAKKTTHAEKPPLPSSHDPKFRIIDIGCGTGRTTLKIIKVCAELGIPAEIVGIDASEKMLDAARDKLKEYLRHNAGPIDGDVEGKPSCEFMHVDIASPDLLKQIFSSSETLHRRALFDLAISTLVLEHLELTTFFTALDKLTNLGSTLVLTNMHPDMGRRSQAGFMGTDEDGKPVKIRGTSYIHGVVETYREADRFNWLYLDPEGFGGAGEVEVRPEMVEILGPRAKKWVGEKVWYGIVATKQGGPILSKGWATKRD